MNIIITQVSSLLGHKKSFVAIAHKQVLDQRLMFLLRHNNQLFPESSRKVTVLLNTICDGETWKCS